tara:strand:- start:179 stop:316 length:138 start_codon:yes stop_codon:yes gene_type:complete
MWKRNLYAKTQAIVFKHFSVCADIMLIKNWTETKYDVNISSRLSV